MSTEQSTAVGAAVEMDPCALEAEAHEEKAIAHEHEAKSHRLLAAAARARGALPPSGTLPSTESHQTRAEYARSRRVSGATVSRWIAEGMPVIPVGTTVRVDPAEADAWRRTRGRKPTTPPMSRAKKGLDVDVSASLGRAGLRSIAGGVR